MVDYGALVLILVHLPRVWAWLIIWKASNIDVAFNIHVF